MLRGATMGGDVIHQPMRLGYDSRKFSYDLNVARASTYVDFGASRMDRLDPSRAKMLLDDIHSKYGVSTLSPEQMWAFDKAFFFSHTLNGASVLQPNEGVFNVGKRSYAMGLALSVLGTDARRFFRTYADEIRDVNRQILGEVDHKDYAKSDKYNQLIQVARARGMEAYPDLAHDSADACSWLTLEQSRVIARSKDRVLD
ncbi:hypothetical protein EsHS_00007541, partial [Epichloe bromicola]